MRKLAKLLGIALAGLTTLVAVAAITVFVLSQQRVNRIYPVVLRTMTVSSAPAVVAEGKRLAATRGCTGCHGTQLEGHVLVDEPGLGALVCPNLTLLLPQYSDAELARAIRRGVKRNGRSIGVMPSRMFYSLSDADLAAIIAYLRTVPVTANALPVMRYGPMARLGLVLGKYHFEAEVIDATKPPVSAPVGPQNEGLGRYVAMTSCTECHGPDLRGDPTSGRSGAPSLGVAAAYSDTQFARFMRTGVSVGDRQLPMMSGVARTRFAHLTDREIGALHGYLKTLAAR
jgi:cytochrome c553